MSQKIDTRPGVKKPDWESQWNQRVTNRPDICKDPRLNRINGLWFPVSGYFPDRCPVGVLVAGGTLIGAGCGRLARALHCIPCRPVSRLVRGNPAIFKKE